MRFRHRNEFQRAWVAMMNATRIVSTSLRNSVFLVHRCRQTVIRITSCLTTVGIKNRICRYRNTGLPRFIFIVVATATIFVFQLLGSESSSLSLCLVRFFLSLSNSASKSTPSLNVVPSSFSKPFNFNFRFNMLRISRSLYSLSNSGGRLGNWIVLYELISFSR